MKVAIVTFGTLGDVYPFVAIGSELRRRGFEVVLAAPGIHRGAVEGEGLTYAALRPDEGDLIAALGVDIPGVFAAMLKNPFFILDEIYMRFIAETYEDVMRVAADADVLMGHGLLVGAHQAAEKLGLPYARVALAPLHIQSAGDPSFTPGAPYRLDPRSRLAIRYNRVVRSAVRSSVGLRLRRLHAFRRKVGLPPTSEDFFLDFGRPSRAAACFGLWSPSFAPPDRDGTKETIVPGFPFYEPDDADRKAITPCLQAFLDGGEPPIVFTLGSFAPAVAGDFYDVGLAAARKLGRRAVLLAGPLHAARLADAVGPEVHVCARAPHARLFPRASCIVHHGGIGTTGEALRAGRPQLVVPFFGDQHDHGFRVARLGVGTTLPLSAFDVRRAAEALGMLALERYARTAETIAVGMVGEPGASAVAAWVAGVTG